MFRGFSSRLAQQVRTKIEETIRPVVDRSVREAFERERHRPLFEGAAGNNPGRLESLNNFLGRYSHLTQAGIGAVTMGLSMLRLHLTNLSYNAQVEANELSRAQIDSNERTIESNERASEHSIRNSIVRFSLDVFDIFRSVFHMTRFSRSNNHGSSDANASGNRDGNVSGHRSSNDPGSSPSPSGDAFRARQKDKENK